VFLSFPLPIRSFGVMGRCLRIQDSGVLVTVSFPSYTHSFLSTYYKPFLFLTLVNLTTAPGFSCPSVTHLSQKRVLSLGKSGGVLSLVTEASFNHTITSILYARSMPISLQYASCMFYNHFTLCKLLLTYPPTSLASCI
jgi:hypothetical protein